MYKVITFPCWPWRPSTSFKWQWVAFLYGWSLSWEYEKVRVEDPDGRTIRIWRR
jgi:hypothetical protein